MDLSLRSSSSPSSSSSSRIIQLQKPILKPIPRQACPNIWFRSMWPQSYTPFLLPSSSSTTTGGAWSVGKLPENNHACFNPDLNNSRSSRSAFDSINSNKHNIRHFHDSILHKAVNSRDTATQLQPQFENERKEEHLTSLESLSSSSSSSRLFLDITSRGNNNNNNNTSSFRSNSSSRIRNFSTTSSEAIDVAACDGPVYFERISNPNFALTVQHSCTSNAPDNNPTSNDPSSKQSHDNNNADELNKASSTATASGIEPIMTNLTSSSSSSTIKNNTTTNCKSSKSYTCIYCSQSFKSLFCYQKHKKRHINPVSVDLTSSIIGSNNSNIMSLTRSFENTNNKMNRSNNSNKNIPGPGYKNNTNICSTTRSVPTSQSNAKYLNVQFFPCKICGSKFPSYYFVHKHIKLCH